MTFRINFVILDPNRYFWLMEGGAIARSDYILLIRATTFFDEYLYCTIYNIEEDPH